MIQRVLRLKEARSAYYFCSNRFLAQSVTFDTDGPVAINSINRPDVKNAVDKETAAHLAVAFRRFESDESLLVGC